ncbi:glycosyltransferase family 4 protein [Thiocystis violacea]|uniref:glycosyltransferase family 4 protein n=1 Tax=Thiocystis violacea TaxID=13725 RepID=UPI001906E3B7|nr:glycosyltransferase family 4 protein [Thiocystis violacea]MBK1718635.1 hypothetical protein [Thiocystis violacea]
MLRVCALTSGINVPSSRFRVRQHISELHKYSIVVEELKPKFDKYSDVPPPFNKLNLRKNFFPGYLVWAGIRLGLRMPSIIRTHHYEITWLEREIQPGFLTFERMLKRPIAWDVDDAIWLKKPFGIKTAKALSQISTVTIAGNNYLADYLAGLGANVVVVPTAIDTERFSPKKQAKDNDAFVIGWTGTSSNFSYLYAIEPALSAFIADRKNAYFHVISDAMPNFKRLPRDRIIFSKWSPTTESEKIKDFDVGIMPLLCDDWSKGKCAFKMLQYMASGLPVIVSPVGMNVEVMSRMENNGFLARTLSEWVDALDYLYLNPDVRVRWGKVGRATAEHFYSSGVIAKKLAEIFYLIS